VKALNHDKNELPVNLLLRETCDERIIGTHERYCEVWTSYQKTREERVKVYNSGKTIEPRETWMKGLAGLETHRSKRIKINTGRYFGK
jgi:hypothetical protein